MTARSPYRVDPNFDGKYYVYMLLRPNNSVFYIGKGLGLRINNHFTPQRINNGSIKSNIIKKYGVGNIKRQIISYHDSEEEAYNLEEYLISYYGVMAEGGVLSNVSKTRYDYPDKVKGYIAKNLPSLPTKYTEQQILEVYHLYYKEGKTTRYISEKLSMCASYLTYILRGAKCKGLFEREGIHALREAKLLRDEGKSRSIPSIQKYPDHKVMEVLKLYYEDNIHMESIVEISGISETYIRSILAGNKRNSLLDIYHTDNPQAKRYMVKASLKEEVKIRLSSGESFSSLLSDGKYPKTCLYRWAKEEGYTFTKSKQYTVAQVIKVYDLHFIDKRNYTDISDVTDIPITYIKSLVKGRKRKSLLSKYISENEVTS